MVLLPVDFVAVRHARSEGNVANHMSYHGDHGLFTPEFKARHSSLWRLVAEGRAQAHIAGDWIRKNIFDNFEHYFYSGAVRTGETAALLGLPHAKWQVDCAFYERIGGDLDLLSHEEKCRQYADQLAKKKKEIFFWRPPGGESLADVYFRLYPSLAALFAKTIGRRVILVTHGHLLWVMRMIIEGIPIADFEAWFGSSEYSDIRNCHILHYSRRNPYTGGIESNLNWVRSVNPLDTQQATPVEWTRIVRKKLSNDELLAEMSKHHPLIIE